MDSPTEPVNDRIRVFILDDHEVARRGLTDLAIPTIEPFRRQRNAPPCHHSRPKPTRSRLASGPRRPPLVARHTKPKRCRPERRAMRFSQGAVPLPVAPRRGHGRGDG
jgi:hypothetical protein